MTVLQARPFRSVLLAHDAGAPVVVKRFHHPNPLLARFDRARARREFEALAALAAAGLSVPRPLALRAAGRSWEVHLAAIPGALALEHFLDSAAPPPGGWPRLLARLGELLARLQAAGWEHGDLHPGNVLVDARGEPWLIDFQRARRAPPDAARSLSELVECAAVAREALPARARARFLVAWLAALPRELRPRLSGAHLARAVEARARLRRIALVRAGLGRWLRASSRVRPLARDGAAGWARRDLAAAVLERTPAELERDGWLVLRARRDELRARWLGAARLLEHRVPVLRPAVLATGSRWNGRGAWAAFEPPSRAPCAGSDEELLAALAERGLGLAGARVVRSGGGRCFYPPREPEDIASAFGGGTERDAGPR